MATILSVLTALVLAASQSGCAFGEIRWDDPMKRGYSLEEAQHRYSALVRFSDWNQALEFVVQEDKEAFYARGKKLKDVSFSDWDALKPELDDERVSATVTVTYTAFSRNQPVEQDIEEIQEWSRDGLGNDWRVRSTFVDLSSLNIN